MLIYVKRTCGLYEPIVDVNSEGVIYIPHWDTAKILDAELEGEKYRAVDAIIGHIKYEQYVLLKDNLNSLLERIKDAQAGLERLNPHGEKRSLVQFMIDNASLLQSSGSYLIKNENSSLEVIDQEQAIHLMERYKEDMAESERLYDENYPEDDDYQDDCWLPHTDTEDDYYGVN